MVRDPRWTEGAVCAQTDPELFFDERPYTVATAKGLCGVCPIREDCLATAMAEFEQWGMWGGLTATERFQLHRAADPDFMWPGEPLRDGDTAIGPWSTRKTCNRGHELTAENVMMVQGGRRCRVCKNMSDRRAKAAKTAKRVAAREAAGAVRSA